MHICIFAYLHCLHLALHELLCMCKRVQTDTYKHAHMMNISKALGQIQDEAYTQLRLESTIASRTKYSQKSFGYRGEAGRTPYWREKNQHNSICTLKRRIVKHSKTSRNNIYAPTSLPRECQAPYFIYSCPFIVKYYWFNTKELEQYSTRTEPSSIYAPTSLPRECQAPYSTYSIFALTILRN